MIDLSWVENVMDSHPETYRDINWSAFVDLMIEQSEVTAQATDEVKRSTPCISPAGYPAGESRSKNNVTGWNWFSADIDNKAGNRPGATIDDIANVMCSLGSPYLIYTTTSNRIDAECFRLMFPVDRTITRDEFDKVWRAFAAHFGCFDEQTKDISRLFIVPRHWSDRQNKLLFEKQGVPVCVDEILRLYPVKQEVLSTPRIQKLHHGSGRYGKSQDLFDIDDSPIISKAAVEAALFGAPGGRMYRFLCSVAGTAYAKGYALDVASLIQIGEVMAVRMGRCHRDDIPRDAENALTFAEGKSAEGHMARMSRLRDAVYGTL